MSRVRYFVSTILILVGVSSSLSAVRAETITLKGELKGTNEVPPNNSPASGQATATLDTGTKTLTWSITFKDLTGPAVAAHFHGPSEPGKNAGIVLPFKSAQSPIEGTAVLTDAQVTDLVAGKWYANIHTAAHPGGELRGQMVKQ
jgi:CHRD domain